MLTVGQALMTVRSVGFETPVFAGTGLEGGEIAEAGPALELELELDCVLICLVYLTDRLALASDPTDRLPRSLSAIGCSRQGSPLRLP